MRFIGNKQPICDDIYDFFKSHGLLKKGYTLFDAFCGTGSVSDRFKQDFNIIINDLLTWPTVYSLGRLNAPLCTFSGLGFDPFMFLNNSTDKTKGFFYRNYSPSESSRMYFTEENASRIDYFRDTINKWKEDKLIDNNEYCYLMASLIESISLVSNTAGVYGAFLKKWDSRALKQIELVRVEHSQNSPKNVKVFNFPVEEKIEDVDCDILYLDPPYTQNQYGTQYHLLETLVLNDNPSLSRITGSRPVGPMKSKWSMDIWVHILFERVVAKTKAKYIILSYSNDGFMSKEFIESVLKRYGKENTFECKQIEYKKYNNWKSENKKQHFEYLFFVEKKEENDVIYESPLNYFGNKSKIFTQIKSFLPANYSKVYDLFGGGFNFGVNIFNHSLVYNDSNFFVKDIIEMFDKEDTYHLITDIKKLIAINGLEKGNENTYKKARNLYNSLPIAKRNNHLLFALIMYGFNQQIRFNSDLEFNNPIGVRWFNDFMLEKAISFSRIIKEKSVSFHSADYFELFDEIQCNDFVYFDPPYLLTNGSYNDGKRGFDGWNIKQQQQLFDRINMLANKGIKFMLSYVSEHKGVINEDLLKWVKENNYKMISIKGASGISGSIRKEVLVINYD